MRRTDLGIPSSEADNESLQPKQLSVTPEAARPAATTGNHTEKSSLDFQRQEIEGNVQILKVQVASAKEELEKLNWESRHFQSRDVFCSLYRSITLCTNPGLERTSCAIWRRSNSS